MVETILHIGSGLAVSIVMLMSSVTVAGLRRDIRIDPDENAPLARLIRWLLPFVFGSVALTIGLAYHFSPFYLLAVVPAAAFSLPAEFEQRRKLNLFYRLSLYEYEFKAVGIAVATVGLLFVGALAVNGLKSVDTLTKECMDRSSYHQRVGAVCRDGSYSYATGSGACSWHGGVDDWDTEIAHSRSLSECRAFAHEESWRD